MPFTRRLRPAPLLGLLLLAAPAAAAEKGAWWELTSEMEMAGMPFAMPATTFKTCMPEADWKRPPEGKQDKNCTVKDVKVSGNTMRWRVSCTGEEPMEGDGEMTRTGDSLTSRTHIKSRQGEMNVKMRGKRVGGACDPEEQRRELEAKADRYREQGRQAQAQADASMAQMCENGIQEMQAAAVLGPAAFCKDPAKKDAFCARVRTQAGYSKLMAQGEMEKASKGAVPGPQAVAKACALDLAAVQKGLCAEAAKAESLAFLAASCPVEAKVIGKRECAGRDYTALRGSKYRDFCARLAGDRMQAGDDEEAQPVRNAKKKKDKKAEEEKQDDEEGAVDKGKKLLKGVLGF